MKISKGSHYSVSLLKYLLAPVSDLGNITLYPYFTAVKYEFGGICLIS